MLQNRGIDESLPPDATGVVCQADTSESSKHPALTIAAIPDEIIAHIFIIGTMTCSDSQEELPFPLLVSGITKWWRNIAINLPAIWSNIVFAGSVYSEHRCSTLWLPRSGTHPLDITIELLMSAYTFERIMSLITPHITRWRKLSVKAWERLDLEVVLSTLRNVSVPLLEHVDLRIVVDESPDLWDDHIQCLTKESPVLKSVRLRGLCLECAPPLIGLTALHLDLQDSLIAYDVISNILTASPHLTSLMLRVPHLQSPADSNLRVIKFPSLRTLAFNFCQCEEALLRLFALLVTPSVESMELIWMNRAHIADYVLQSRRQSIKPQFPNLRELKFFRCGGSADNDGLFNEHMHNEFMGFFPVLTSLGRVDDHEGFPPPKIEKLQELTLRPTENQLQWLFKEVKGQQSNSYPLPRILVSRIDTESLNQSLWSQIQKIAKLEVDSDSFRYTGQSDDEISEEGHELYAEEEEDSDEEDWFAEELLSGIDADDYVDSEFDEYE